MYKAYDPTFIAFFTFPNRAFAPATPYFVAPRRVIPIIAALVVSPAVPCPCLALNDVLSSVYITMVFKVVAINISYTALSWIRNIWCSARP